MTTYTIQWHIPGQSNAVLMVDAGWPMRSLYGQVDIAGVVHNGLPAPTWFRARRAMTMARPVPLRPFWGGLVFNSLSGAALIWSIVVPPRVALRKWRRHRGRCAACGYDLRGMEHERCPECGFDERCGSKAD